MPTLKRALFVVAAAFLAVAGVLASVGALSDPLARLTVPPGFSLELVAHVADARELAFTPGGDLLVGTLGNDVAIVTTPENDVGKPHTFAHLDDTPAAGLALGSDALYVGTCTGIWKIPYRKDDRTARGAAKKIGSVRPGGCGGHQTTSLAVDGATLYASVGSSCNECDPEADDTRATIEQMSLDGTGMHPKAVHIRNAIALALNPATHVLWAGNAGQDELPHGHPYEIFDPVTAHEGTVDYGWPHCYENRKPAQDGRDCSHQTVQRVAFPAYDTPIGAVIYRAPAHAAHAFPQAYDGGAFVTLHGSWHRPSVPPRVAFVALRGDEPVKAVDWNDPSKQWREFVSGYQAGDGERVGRPTGIAVGPEGSLFVADDLTGNIYRIRPKQ